MIWLAVLLSNKNIYIYLEMDSDRDRYGDRFNR